MPEGYIVGIDVGTSKLCSTVALREMSGAARYVGHGSAPSTGVRAGEVNDPDELGAAFKRAVEEARYLIGAPVQDIVVCMSGVRIEALERGGDLALNGGRAVEQVDVMRAIAGTRGTDPPGLHTIHRVVQRLALDGRQVDDPTGRSGRRLEVTMRDFAVPAQLVERLRRAADIAGLRIHTLIPAGIAAATAGLLPEERKAGVALVDIGSATTDIAVYVDDVPRFVGAFGLGGSHITSDIAGILDVPPEEAEQLKRASGALDEADDEEELIDWSPRTIAILQRQARYKEVPPAAIRSIAAARAIQIIDLLHDVLRGADAIGSLRAGVVLTGGTSQLRGIDSLARAILGVPVRCGAVLPGDGFPSIADATATASIGLVRYCALRANAGPAGRSEARSAGATAIVHPVVMGMVSGRGRRDTIDVISAEPYPSRRRESRDWGRACRAWLREFIPARNDDAD